jgi:hypothetical protein
MYTVQSPVLFIHVVETLCRLRTTQYIFYLNTTTTTTTTLVQYSVRWIPPASPELHRGENSQGIDNVATVCHLLPDSIAIPLQTDILPCDILQHL